jgi:glucose/arabinose dehydrogenase
MRRNHIGSAALRLVFALSILTSAPLGLSAEPKAPKLGGLPAVTLTPITTSGLTAPVQATSAHDGSGRLFVVDHDGVVFIVENGALLPTPFLDIHTLVKFQGEQGLNSIVFHPDYESNGFFYVNYVNTSGDIAVARYSVSAGDPDVADPNSAQIVLVVPHPTNTNHYGGQMFFGPNDGYLYVSTGDGGSGGDPPNNAQNLDKLLGKMLRIDVDGTGAVPCGQANVMPYAIPPTNPFAGSAHCGEIWAYGMRNPWRWSFDRSTADLIVGDVGQNCYEEVDFQPAASPGGENYGWRIMEGLHCYNTDGSCNPVSCNQAGLTLPVIETTHTDGWCALIGGFVYRGTVIPGLSGMYLYSDNCLGDIYAATPGAWSPSLLLPTSLGVSGFGEDEAGEVYVVDYSGGLYRVDPATFPGPVVAGLSPASAIAGDPDLALSVVGTGFAEGSVVRWNGSDRPTTFQSSTLLTASIPASDLAASGFAQVTVFTPAPGGGSSSAVTFDINTTFLDVPNDDFAHDYIDAVFNAGVTAGCDVRLYCPTAPTTRAQMAVFLLKASQGSGYTPPPCSGTLFDDVPCTGGVFDPWIEDLANRGITGGCQLSPPLYCPAASVTRAQMSAFLLKTEHGSSYVPPACAGLFADVACPSLFADWIEQLAAEGITAGCGGGNFCPNNPNTRGQMAVFLTKTFNLPLP